MRLFHGISCLFLSLSLSAQTSNLVLNPSFEAHSPCNRDLGDVLDSMEVWKAVAGNPRWTNPSCPLNEEQAAFVQGMKLPPAFTGKAYVGLGLGLESEYLEGRLSEALVAGQTYRVALRVRIPIRFCQKGLLQLGFDFSETSRPAQAEASTLDAKNLTVLENGQGTRFSKQYDWEYIEGFYTAKGGELYFSIGNFRGMNQKIFAQDEANSCYYLFIDQVDVRPYKAQTLEDWQAKAEGKTGARYRLSLKTVGNEPDWQASSEQFKALAEWLKQKPNLKVKLSTHVFAAESEAENQALSENWMQELQFELTRANCPTNRMEFSALGSSRPLGPRNRQNDAQINQRIELEILN